MTIHSHSVANAVPLSSQIIEGCESLTSRPGGVGDNTKTLGYGHAFIRKGTAWAVVGTTRMRHAQNRLTQRQGMKGRAGLLLAPWLLLAWGSPALAWSEKDCNQPPYDEYRHTFKKCVDAVKVAAQQKQPDGSQPTEAQRYARVREILRKQKVVRFEYSVPSSPQQRQVCEARLKDLQAGRGYEPIEPVYVLDDAWQAANPEQTRNNSNAPRLPSNWNLCAYSKELITPKSLTLAGYMDRLRPNPPPYRLYELKPHQRPSPVWQFMVDMTFGEKHFGAFSADSCEEIGSIISFYGESSRQQSWALTQYQGTLAIVGAIDQQELEIGARRSSSTSNDYCTWSLHSRPRSN